MDFSLKELFKEVEYHQKYLNEELIWLRNKIEDLLEENKELKEEIEALEDKVDDLEGQLEE